MRVHISPRMVDPPQGGVWKLLKRHECKNHQAAIYYRTGVYAETAQILENGPAPDIVQTGFPLLHVQWAAILARTL
jgi:hypothetical protein